MPIIQKISAASIPGRITATGREAPENAGAVAMPSASERYAYNAGRELRRIMADADVKQLGDVDRLSGPQLARILENKTPGERIATKFLIQKAGLYPRQPPPF
jgi:hypothetical protein